MADPIRRVLISGAGGFVGRTTARRLARSGIGALGLYRNTLPAGLADVPGVTLIKSNLENPSAKLPPDFDALIHCAAEVPATCPDEATLIERNVNGTRRIFDHARRHGAWRIIYCSSMAGAGV